MKKNSFILLGFFLVIGLSAQKDSLRKFQFSGIQVDVGLPIYPNYKQQNQADYQKVIKNDPFLNADLSTYQKQQRYVYNSDFTGLTGLKCYVIINDKRKLNKEIFFGLKYGEERNNGFSYDKFSYDTIAAYTTNRKFYKIYGTYSEYSYAYTSQKLVVPLGITISSDKMNVSRITMGLELSPVLNFNYVFTSTNEVVHANFTVTEGEKLTNQLYNFFGRDKNVIQRRTKLSGMGYGLYASLPFTVYLHLFKRILFLKHLNLLASMTPLYVYSFNKYFGSASSITMSMATGIRYNW